MKDEKFSRPKTESGATRLPPTSQKRRLKLIIHDLLQTMLT